MKKITELTEVKLRTVYSRDEYGNQEGDIVEYIFKREVATVNPGTRFLHYIIDVLLFRLFVYAIISLFKSLHIEFTFETDTQVSVFNLFFTIILFVFFYSTFESIWQRTPGKLITNCVVIDEYGNAPDAITILLRTVCRLVPFEPFSCLGDKYSYGWHDKWSKTWVVSKSELEELKRIQTENELLESNDKGE